jgi:translation initiation factor IF-3
VRVIDENGAQVGVMSTREALSLAESKELDLIEVAPDAVPPVCRIMDYGKYKYAQSKKEQEQRRKHKAAEVKILRLRPNISIHDIETKAKQVRGFLQDGDKVRINLIFKSREMSHPEIGRQVLNKIAELTAEAGGIESAPRFEGRMLTMILVPKVAATPVAEPERQTTNSR